MRWHSRPQHTTTTVIRHTGQRWVTSQSITVHYKSYGMVFPSPDEFTERMFLPKWGLPSWLKHVGYTVLWCQLEGG